MVRRRVGAVREGERPGRGYTLVYVVFRGFRGAPGREGRTVSKYIRVPVAGNRAGNVLRAGLAWLEGFLERNAAKGRESGGSVSDWQFDIDLSIGI